MAVLFCLDEWVLKVGEREKLNKWGAGMKNRVFYGWWWLWVIWFSDGRLDHEYKEGKWGKSTFSPRKYIN